MITLFQFQEEAASAIADRFIDYLGDPVLGGSKRNPRVVPFFQALSAITGAGKTVILAEAVSQIAATMPISPVVLWLSRGKVVVRQTFANLNAGGKYHHLLHHSRVIPLADYDPVEVEEANCPLIFFATVGTFNQSDREESSLTIFRSEVDTTETSTWNALKERTDGARRRRPLIVVYDEGHNLSDQQTDLLLELEPDGFLLASATMRLPALLAREVDTLHRAGWGDERLVTSVPSSAVVENGLVKSAVVLAGYNSPMEETIAAMLGDMAEAEHDAAVARVGLRPKAIYVCNTNVVADDTFRTDDPRQPFLQRQAPPILIWRYLTEQCGVLPEQIAVYANLTTNRDYPPPEEFVLFRGADNDYESFAKGDFQHIIFNLSLQEGWDDPSAYFAYVDKSMDSRAQVTQIIGRVLRQPGATHYPAARLNTAHFYVRVDRNETFNEVLTEVGDRLGSDIPEVHIVASPPGRPKPVEFHPKEERTVPHVALVGTEAKAPVEEIIAGLSNYTRDGANTRGEGSRRVVQQRIGDDADQGEWETFEQSSRVSARWIIHREVQRRYRDALGVINLADPKFDAVVGVGSPAYRHLTTVADQIVSTYIDSAYLKQQGPNPYTLGTILGRPGEVRNFRNALHEGYAGLNSLELKFAEALDQTGLVWCRNTPRTGYGIPLISPGDTAKFFPDFIFWSGHSVVCVDTKGPHLIADTAVRKLLRIRPRPAASLRLEIQFVSPGRWSSDLMREDSAGYTVWGLGGDGRRRVRHFAALDDVVKHLVHLANLVE